MNGKEFAMPLFQVADQTHDRTQRVANTSTCTCCGFIVCNNIYSGIHDF